MHSGTCTGQRCVHVAPRPAGGNGRPPWLDHRHLRPLCGGEVKSRGDLSQVDAARPVGCSRDTIVRARRSGRFPGARLDGDRWIIPAADLVAAGLYQRETPADTPSASTAGAPPPADSTAVALARAEARIAGLNEVVGRQDDELRFLRLTVET